MTSQTFKADATVGPGGKVEVNLPLPTGTSPTVPVLPSARVGNWRVCPSTPQQV
jgi:hypothetical protein